MPSNYREIQLELTKDSQKFSGRQQLFYALADPTRREILELLATYGKMSATEVYENFTTSHPAVSQHLGVLRHADLVRLQKIAQKHIYSLNPDGISELERWVDQFRVLMDQRFQELDKVLEKEKRKDRRGK